MNKYIIINILILFVIFIFGTFLCGKIVFLINIVLSFVFFKIIQSQKNQMNQEIWATDCWTHLPN